MMETLRSAAAGLTLEEVLRRLRARPTVDGIVLAGTTAQSSTGDIDLVVVLRTPIKDPFEVVFAYIERRPADVILTASGTIDSLLESNWHEGLGHDRESLLRWIAEGRFALDRSGRLAAVRERVGTEKPRAWRHSDRVAAWWDVNYDVIKARLYLQGQDEIYAKALRWRLLYGIHHAGLHYFTARDLPWRGEKDAIRYWSSEDPEFLEMFERCLAETDLDAKVELYVRLAQFALQPVGGPWLEGTGPRSALWEGLVGAE